MGAKNSRIIETKDVDPPKKDVTIHKDGGRKQGKRIVFNTCFEQDESKGPEKNNVITKRIGRQNKDQRIIFKSREDEHKSHPDEMGTSKQASLLERKFQPDETSVIVIAETIPEKGVYVAEGAEQRKSPADLTKLMKSYDNQTSNESMVVLPGGISTTATRSSKLNQKLSLRST